MKLKSRPQSPSLPPKPLGTSPAHFRRGSTELRKYVQTKLDVMMNFHSVAFSLDHLLFEVDAGV